MVQGVMAEAAKINTRKCTARSEKNFVYQKIDLNEDTRGSEVGDDKEGDLSVTVTRFGGGD